MNSTIIFRTFCPICTAGEFLPICARNVLARGSEPVQWAVSVNPSHAVRNTSCCAPFSARSPPCGGLFPPFLPPSAPKCRLFRPVDPALRLENLARSPRHSPADARFSRLPPGAATRMPPDTRPAVRRFPAQPPAFAPGNPAFPRCAPADCPRVPAKRRPPPPRAPQPPTLGVRRRPKLRPAGATAPPGFLASPCESVWAQGGLGPWERSKGDRRPLPREISRNWGPGVSSPKIKKTAPKDGIDAAVVQSEERLSRKQLTTVRSRAAAPSVIGGNS